MKIQAVFLRPMMKIYRYLFGIVLTLCICSEVVLAEPVTDAHTKVELVTDGHTIQPGRPFWVGLRMTMEGKWQTYWKNPGDSGLSTVIEWELPEGMDAGDIQWPFPIRMDYPEITSYGYEKEVVLLSEITPASDIAVDSSLIIKAHVTWLACGNICVPGKADLALEVVVEDKIPSADESIRDLFKKTMADWPLRQSEWLVEAYDQGDSFRLDIIPPEVGDHALTQVVFFPDSNDLIDHKAEQVFKRNKNGYQLVIAKPAVAYGSGALQLKGILVSQEAWEGTRRALSIEAPINF